MASNQWAMNRREVARCLPGFQASPAVGGSSPGSWPSGTVPIGVSSSVARSIGSKVKRRPCSWPSPSELGRQQLSRSHSMIPGT